MLCLLVVSSDISLCKNNTPPLFPINIQERLNISKEISLSLYWRQIWESRKTENQEAAYCNLVSKRHRIRYHRESLRGIGFKWLTVAAKKKAVSAVILKAFKIKGMVRAECVTLEKVNSFDSQHWGF